MSLSRVRYSSILSSGSGSCSVASQASHPIRPWELSSTGNLVLQVGSRFIFWAHEGTRLSASPDTPLQQGCLA